jgi:hypothetical protein
MDLKELREDGGNTPRWKIAEGETLFLTIPATGAIREIVSKTDRDGRKYDEYRFALETGFEPIKDVILVCSKALAEKIDKAAYMYGKLPVRIAITREGSGQRDTRYSVERMKTE